MRLLLPALALLVAVPALADVPPYQPSEDACAGQDDGGSCNINLGAPSMGAEQEVKVLWES